MSFRNFLKVFKNCKLEENKNSQHSVSGAQDVERLQQENESLQAKIFSQSSKLTTQITTVIEAVQSVIDDLDSKKNSVDKLQSQVNDLKKKIDAKQNHNVDQLKNLKNQLEAAQNDFPEKESKSLDSHQASKRSLGTLKELCEYANSLEKNQQNENPSTTLLNNLCTGLEKFLGYEKGNYTGEGIVYSDLDRLCDGVMSFLHGVLESVKGDDSVKTYDNNMRDEEKLDKLLKELYDSIGKGSGVLADQVGKVSAWLGRYESEVNKKCEDVKTPVREMKTLINHDKTLIEEEQHNALKKQVGDWTHRAKLYIEKAEKAKNALDHLDPTLSGKLNNNISLLLQATKTFDDNARSDDLKRMSDVAGTKMTEITEYIRKTFGEKSALIRTYLKKEIGALHEKLEGLRAGKFTALGILVKNELQIAFGEVRAGINALEKRYGGEIAGPVGSLKSYSESFEKRFRTTHTALQNAIKAVETDIGNLNELEKVEQIMEGANSYVQVPLLQAMQKGTAFSELKTYFRNLDSQVMKHVMEAMEAIAKGSTYLYPTDLNEVKAPLTKVRGILDGTSAVPNFQEIIAQLKEYGVKTDDVDDLKTKLPKLSGTVQIAIEKVERSETPQKQETSSLFTALAQIVDAVSQHSNDIVTALVKAINDKVKEEVTAVVKVIKANVTKIKNGIENTVDDRHDYGGGSPGVGQPAPGLQKLVSEFKSQINQELTTLQGNVGKEADRKEGDSIYSNLLKVKADVTDLGTKVANVVDHVDKVSTDLAACILDAEMLIANASQMTEKAIVQLRDAANIKIQQAFTSLQSKAKSLYTERKTKEVEALQKIVEKEFTAIDSIIKHDKQRGLKGLLTKLQMSLDAHLQEFGTKSQKPHTVSQFAEIVRNSHMCSSTDYMINMISRRWNPIFILMWSIFRICSYNLKHLNTSTMR
ncbi:hypothetical protein, conserved [Babesia ovata]|uniref:Extracellular matrix-binding ebh n=1 Tax=Babesia ovata TaxID=189622 RepID=A0A2H6KJK6_9APIC|nr:uncharacterized protein BOVATA_046610 [Babesia ovata]GBE63168.1 hypothetical protein, conserved [Babesia ovata]